MIDVFEMSERPNDAVEVAESSVTHEQRARIWHLGKKDFLVPRHNVWHGGRIYGRLQEVANLSTDKPIQLNWDLLLLQRRAPDPIHPFFDVIIDSEESLEF
ncbi:hypothetical protein R1flu_015978 [Riccia fluitans]|uniref:Uncharacterized protein n=1 Tax=Riccia fluitans TaxID=41844 RepID=A0ABD1YKJ9_9MARC